MSSFFRRGDQSSSSEEESSSDASTQGHDEQSHVGLGDADISGPNVLLPSEERSQGHPDHPASSIIVNDPSYHRDVILHTLLEDKCLHEALDFFNNRPGNLISYTRSHPDVQSLAKAKYQDLSRHLVDHGLAAPGIQADELQTLRQGYRLGLEHLSLQSTLKHAEAEAAELEDLRQIHRSNSAVIGSLPSEFQKLLVQAKPSSPEANADQQLVTHRGRQDSRDISHHASLSPLPSIIHPFIDHPMLDASRYSRDFVELGLLGKGGYGKVFHVKNRLDSAQYAVKKITLSRRRINRIHEKGQPELDHLLAELRTLARLDHPNIVRYYSGWLEYCNSAVSDLHGTLSKGNPLLYSEEPSLSSHCLDTSFSQHATGSVGVLPTTKDRELEIARVESLDSWDATYTETIARFDGDELVGATKVEERHQNSESSNPGLDNDPDSARKYDAADLSNQSKPSLSFTQLIPGGAVSVTRPALQYPSLTLHIQMSLHPLTLSEFLSPDNLSWGSNKTVKLQHCFHPCVSLQIFLAVLDGVEYLHGEGVLHRDLKPSNIFLSVSDAASRRSNFVNISGCRDCGDRPAKIHQFIDIRIGDFGLVTAIANPDEETTVLPPSRAVGTEFYRPPVDSVTPTEKLDVFALGVIAFELLWEFQTGMERSEILKEVRLGRLPPEFCQRLGKHGPAIEHCIKGMLCADERERLSCKDVRERLKQISKAIG